MKASVKNVKISPKKASVIASLVRGKAAAHASQFLKVVNKKAAGIIKKVIDSAVANATNNEAKSADGLKIKSVVVTKGRVLRRGIPASRGRVAPIKKRYAHVFVELEDGTGETLTHSEKKVIRKVEKEEEAEVKATKPAPAKKPAAKKPAAKKTTTKKPAAKKSAPKKKAEKAS